MDLFDQSWDNSTQNYMQQSLIPQGGLTRPMSTIDNTMQSSPFSTPNRRYSLDPWSSYLSPIITTTRTHAIKRNKRSSTYSRWTAEEDESLKKAIMLHGSHKWSLIAAHVPNRTPMQCSTRWLGALNPNVHKGRWTEEEDIILRFSVIEYANATDAEGQLQPIPWNRIAERIPNRTGIQCQARWTEALDPYVRKGKWVPEEDSLLRMGVENYGKCWIRIAEIIPGRTQRQCRTRWMQIKCKEDRKPPAADKKKKMLREYDVSTDDDEDINTQPIVQKEPQTPLFVLDNLNLPFDTTDISLMDTFKEEDLFFAENWPNVLSQSAFL